MEASTVHYADNNTNALKKLHNKLRPAGTPVQRVEYIIEFLLLTIFETRCQVLKDLLKIKTETEKKIYKLLAGVWGAEFIETVNKEVAHE
ncbi:hypothetical protein BH11BAC3_BH11BAC3_10400 [soil metagenome]